MCRALLYLGEPVLLDNFLYQPDSALVRQSIAPRMLNMQNLAGFGMRAWDADSPNPERAFSYHSEQIPVYDQKLKGLAEKAHTGCLLAHVRGVAPSRTDISLQNCHPFHFKDVPLVMAHNGDLARFADMKSLLAPHVKPEFAAQIHGTTDSEWVYALIASNLPNPRGHASADELAKAVECAIGIICDVRKQLGISISSSLNLFLADGTQLAAIRYCFDFGCFSTEDPSRMHEANLNYLSLWYTGGRDYGLHDGEWQMTGGSENATSILVASEPLTSDTAAWVEVPEYSMLHATIKKDRPVIVFRDL